MFELLYGYVDKFLVQAHAGALNWLTACIRPEVALWTLLMPSRASKQGTWSMDMVADAFTKLTSAEVIAVLCKVMEGRQPTRAAGHRTSVTDRRWKKLDNAVLTDASTDQER